MNSPTVPAVGSFNQNIKIQERYRTFWPRFWAGFIDGLVFLPFSYLDDYLSKPGWPAGILISWAVFYSFLGLSYSILMHARFGQTLGKMVCHVKVWDVSETRLPSLKQAFLRDIGTVLPNIATLVYFTFLVLSNSYKHTNQQFDNLPAKILAAANLAWFLVEIISMLSNRKRRALHDFIAGTVVCID